MLFELAIGDQKFNLKDVEEFIEKMFKDKGGHKVIIKPEERTLKIEVLDEIGNRVKEALCPPNIKEGTILGYYYLEKKLCMLPLKDRKFIIKKGCKHNKIVRPLFSLQRARKERENGNTGIY